MAKVFIVNALPASVLLGALHEGEGAVQFSELSTEEAAEAIQVLGAVSAVGHADTAGLFSNLLDMPIEFQRLSVPAFGEGTKNLIAGLYTGPRLPEGSTTLPEGASIRWVLVTPLDRESAHGAYFWT